jgi:hypothetical protein
MQKVKTADFEKELQEIDPRLFIIPNKNRPGASNVFLNGVDICPWVSSFEIQDEHSPDYTYNLNDTRVPFKTSGEIKEIINIIITKIQDKAFADEVFDAPLDVKEETYGKHKA